MVSRRTIAVFLGEACIAWASPATLQFKYDHRR